MVQADPYGVLVVIAEEKKESQLSFIKDLAEECSNTPMPMKTGFHKDNKSEFQSRPLQLSCLRVLHRVLFLSFIRTSHTFCIQLFPTHHPFNYVSQTQSLVRSATNPDCGQLILREECASS